MTKKNKRLVRAAALCLVLCMLLSLAACAEQKPAETTEDTQAAEPVLYTIAVTSQGGAPLSGVGIYVYADSTQEELVWFAKTDDEGRISFTDAASDSYVAVLTGLPEGYQAEESYPLTGENTEIVLNGDMTVEGDLENITYRLGDAVYNFTFTAADGTEYVLADLLEEKQAVVLNFWYLECSPCKAEFPYLQEAYEQYSDKIALLAMNPVNTDPAEVAAFQEELGLTFPMGLCDSAWESAMQLTGYPTTVVIDRYGTIAMIHRGTIPDTQTFLNIFSYFTADDYVQTLVEDVEELPDVEEREVPVVVNNPTDIGGVTSFQVTVLPGEVVYVNIYKLSGMYMSIKNDNAYVIYKDKTYQPSNGTVGLVISADDTMTAIRVGFGNSGTEMQTYTVNFSALKGSYGNPYTLELGKFSVTVNAGNNQGVYFIYDATESGTLTMQCLGATAGVNYDFVLYNLNTYAYRNIGPEGGLSVEGTPTVSVTVRKGDRVQVIVGSLPDEDHSYPKGTFEFLATFDNGTVEEEVKVQKQTYALTVTDEERTPVPGVTVYISGGETTTTLTTDENGVAGANLAQGTYTARLTVPDGYTANTVEFMLTESCPTVSAKLDTVAPEETAVYTVQVVDENGNPVSGALVSVDTSFGYTDASGQVSFTLNRGEYTAMIVAPEGYTSDAVSYTFAAGTTKLTVTVTAESGEEETPTDPTESTESTKPTESTEGTESTEATEATEPTQSTTPAEPDKQSYTVTVLDAAGEPLSQGVVVQFLKNGKPAAMKVTNTQGVASAKLEPGDYTVAPLLASPCITTPPRRSSLLRRPTSPLRWRL